MDVNSGGQGVLFHPLQPVSSKRVKRARHSAIYWEWSGAQTQMWSCSARLVGKTAMESFSRYPGVSWRLSPAVCSPRPPTRGVVFIRASPGSSLLVKGVRARLRLLSWSPAREDRALTVRPRPSPAAHASNELSGGSDAEPRADHLRDAVAFTPAEGGLWARTASCLV